MADETNPGARQRDRGSECINAAGVDAPKHIATFDKFNKKNETSADRLAFEARGDHRERSDAYVGVVSRLDPRSRVIVCRDALQWVLQRRDAGSPHQAHWRGIRYHLSRDALVRSCVTLCERCDPAALAALAALSDLIRRAGA